MKVAPAIACGEPSECANHIGLGNKPCGWRISLIFFVCDLASRQARLAEAAKVALS